MGRFAPSGKYLRVGRLSQSECNWLARVADAEPPSARDVDQSLHEVRQAADGYVAPLGFSPKYAYAEATAKPSQAWPSVVSGGSSFG